MGFLEFIALANNVPFAISLGLMAGIASLQAVSLVLGLGISEVIDDAFDFDTDVDVDPCLEFDADMDIDADFDVDGVPSVHSVGDQLDLNGDGPSFGTNFFGWLQLGKVPFLILLSAFLGTFGFFGAAGQWVIAGILGGPVSWMLAAPLALIAALPATRFVGQGVGKLMPKEESSSIRLSDLTGSVATIITGTATAEMSAEAKIVDSHGTAHFVRVKPLDMSKEFLKGTEVRLMEKEGNTFRVVEQ